MFIDAGCGREALDGAITDEAPGTNRESFLGGTFDGVLSIATS
jgi:hypothetical protein